MSDHLNRGPHALEAAYKKLIVELDQNLPRPVLGRPEIKPGPYTNSQNVCDRMERFVSVLAEIPDGLDELQQRAAFVSAECRPGSAFSRARTRALQRSQKPGASCGAIKRLKAMDGTPVTLAEVLSARRDIERVLNYRDLELPPKRRAAFCSWLEACVGVQRHAEAMEADGCRYLAHVYESAVDNQPWQAGYAKAEILSEFGVACLESIKASAASIMAWASQSDPSFHRSSRTTVTKKPRRRGRKKADYETRQKENEILEEWRAARESKVVKKDFARDRGMKVADLDRLLDRTAKRQRSVE